MPSLDALANIPGYGAYIAKKQMNEQQPMQDIQQASALIGLRNAIQSQQQDEALKMTLSQSAGDVQSALNAALRAGNLGAASKLAALVEAQRKQSAPQVVAPGAQLVGPNGEVIHTTPTKPDRPQNPSNVNRLLEEKALLPPGDPRHAIYDAAIKKETEGTRPPRETYPIVTTGDGIFERRPEGLVRMKDPTTGEPLRPTARERPITEYQGKNALYGSRAQMADKTLNDLEEKINLAGLATKQSIQGAPLIGGVAGAIGNTLLSSNQQAVEQAQRNFVNAVLRQESGAVISEPEFENAKKQYFPQPGDKPSVIKQKRDNRRVAIEGFKKIAGPAWTDAPTSPDANSSILDQADAILKK